MLVTFAFALANKLSGSEFYDFLKQPDASYRFEHTPGSPKIDLTSQTWRGKPWRHTILMSEPKSPIAKGIGLLFITGGSGGPGDPKLAELLASKAKISTSVIFDIPNQPLYGGNTEDDLIAFTFDQYLKTHDPTWPILFPMTKSILRAMDAIEAVTSKGTNPIHRFVIAGASKRGWTTWLVGAAKDPRVKAIAPMVIDNLNLGQQMKRQVQEWGRFSEQIEAYTKLGLQAKFASEEGRHLAEIVDPFTYRSSIQVPTLVFKGSNDPYWTVDAMDQYWDQLHQLKWEVTIPNAGHGLGDKSEAIETLGAFAQSMAGVFEMPRETYSLAYSGAKKACLVRLKSTGLPLVSFRVWVAESEHLDFRPSQYVPAKDSVTIRGGQASVLVQLPGAKNVALFGEATYRSTAGTFRLCSPTKLILRRN